jgi:ParB-like chromosome segregation protein Spo0J
MGVLVSKKEQILGSSFNIEMIDPHKLTPYPHNPRINQHAIPQVKKVLQEVGFRQPIVVDKEYVVVVGHTRLEAAKQLGYTKVPVHVAYDLTPAQIRAYRLADNKVGEIAEWNTEELSSELAGLMQFDEIDLSKFGFSKEDIEGLEQKPDVRWLEDFDVSPAPKPRWILISAPEDKCAEILEYLNQVAGPGMKFEYSGDTSKG